VSVVGLRVETSFFEKPDFRIEKERGKVDKRETATWGRKMLLHIERRSSGRTHKIFGEGKRRFINQRSRRFTHLQAKE